jgi:uncharacterized membrane-anchored protein YjiN (DUF445 family)
MMDQKRRALRNNKALALAMMVCAGILFVIARLHQEHGAWQWVGAFSEAAMIGALADWFAVVALFRHPLGIPIPHTAIIPGKKDAIAESLAEFIRDKFLATEALVSKIRKLNPAEHLTTYLVSGKNAAGLAQGITRVISDSLDFIDDERVRTIMLAAINNRIGKIDFPSSLGSILDVLRTNNRHQAVLDELLGKVAAWLALPESHDKIARAIDTWCSTEYPLLVKFIPNREQFAKGAGEKIAGRINSFIQAVNADSGHELREHFDRAVSEFAARLRNDGELRDSMETMKQNLMDNLKLSDYIRNLCADLEAWVRNDLELPQSRIREHLAAAAVGLGNTLAKSADLKDSINQHLEMVVRKYADDLRRGFSKHVSGTIKQWEDDDFVGEIELSIGSDLQFIRMNGTLVGGLIGLLLHAISLHL